MVTARGEDLRPTNVTSLDGRVRVRLALTTEADSETSVQWDVTFGDRPVLLPSALRIDLANGTSLGRDCRIIAVHAREVRSRYQQHPGKRRDLVEDGREVELELEERGSSRRWTIVLRAYNDGVALRYRFPAQDGWPSLEIAREQTAFRFPAGAEAHFLPLASFTTSHEGRYVRRPVSRISENQLLGLPLLVELADSRCAAVAEANLTNYAGMYLTRPEGTGAVALLESRLSPLPNDADVSVRAELPHESPWRVVLIARHPHELIESDLLLHLNAPCAIEDTTWIRPGKTTFPWWNGYHEENVGFELGLNTATAKHYIDFCAAAGIAYHSLDGLADKAWYDGPIVPYEGADPTRAISTIDLPEVLRYAKSKGVRLRLWMHWQAAQRHMTRSFPLYREWGIEGVMLDFMDRDDQEMVQFQRRVLETAAANQLTVTFHGVAQPTGLERTFPNLLSSEGVRNLEYDKWDEGGVTPEYEVTVPFTRMLAGPLDFHQGSLRGVPFAEFRPRNEAPVVIGTPCRMLASYVVFQNHLPMMADYPSAYRGHPLLPVLAEVPCTWDDTRALAGEPGKFVLLARRQGDSWWVGAMNGREPRTMRVAFDFLGTGRYRATLYRDELSKPHRTGCETFEVGRNDWLEVGLASAGGWVARLVPIQGGTGKSASEK